MYEPDHLRSFGRSKPLRLLFVVEAFHSLGGMQEMAHQLAQHAMQLGNLVAIVSIEQPVKTVAGVPRTRIERDIDSIKVHPIYIRTRKPFDFHHPKRYLRDVIGAYFGMFAKILSGWKPHVVSCHVWRWDTFPSIVSACRAARIPVCFTLHGYGGPGHLGTAALRYLLRADAVVANALDTRRQYAEHLPQFSECSVIMGGVNWKEACNAKPYQHTRPYIFCASRLYLAQKALITLIDSFALTVKRNSDIDLIIAGEGPDRASIEQHIVQNAVSNRVRLIGANPQSELWPFYKGSKLVAIPGLGLNLLEAMATGKPCVGVDLPFTADLKTHRAEDFMLLAHGPQQVANAFSRLLQDHHLQQRLGGAAQLVSRKFEWDHVVKEYLSLFHTLS